VEEVRWAGRKIVRNASLQAFKVEPKSLNPAEAPMPILYSHPSIVTPSLLQNVFFSRPLYGAMACMPMAYPPMSPAPKSEPESTPQPWSVPAWKLPNLGPYPKCKISSMHVVHQLPTFGIINVPVNCPQTFGAHKLKRT
jgi:hypothetical protein